jgi:hypothetical protein
MDGYSPNPWIELYGTTITILFHLLPSTATLTLVNLYIRLHWVSQWRSCNNSNLLGICVVRKFYPPYLLQSSRHTLNLWPASMGVEDDKCQIFLFNSHGKCWLILTWLLSPGFFWEMVYKLGSQYGEASPKKGIDARKSQPQLCGVRVWQTLLLSSATVVLCYMQRSRTHQALTTYFFLLFR